MHRSGTSAVTGVLESLGSGIGKSIMPPSPSNPKGYFENKRIVDYNDHLIKHSGFNWADVYLLPFGFFQEERSIKEHKEALKKIILEDFDAGYPILIKDPRMCILLPFWKVVFEELHLAASYVIVNRHPGGVVKSLKKRDNLSALRSEKLWLYYNICAELYSREENRLFISYDHFLTSFPETLNRLGSFLPFLTNKEPGRDSTIDQFIDPALNHHSPGHELENFYFRETGTVNDLIEQAGKTDNFEELAVNMDDIRNRLNFTDAFRSVDYEENQARITLNSIDGSSFSQLFKITYETKQIDLEFEHIKKIEKIIFNPINCSCLINFNRIQLFDQRDQLINTGDLNTNASYIAGDLFLFNCPFPIIEFTIDPSDKAVRLVITLKYLIFGDSAHNFYSETQLKNLINHEHELKINLNKAQKDLLKLNKQLENKTMLFNKLKQSLLFKKIHTFLSDHFL